MVGKYCEGLDTFTLEYPQGGSRGIRSTSLQSTESKHTLVSIQFLLERESERERFINCGGGYDMNLLITSLNYDAISKVSR